MSFCLKINNKVNKEFILPAETIRVSFTFLFSNAWRRMANYQGGESAENLRDAKEMRDKWRRKQINLRIKNIRNDMERIPRNKRESVNGKGKRIKEIHTFYYIIPFI